MRVLLVITATIAGALGYRTIERYGPAILWHIFTTDTRSTR